MGLAIAAAVTDGVVIAKIASAAKILFMMISLSNIYRTKVGSTGLFLSAMPLECNSYFTCFFDSAVSRAVFAYD